VGVVENLLVTGKQFFPGIVTFVIDRDGGFDGAEFFFGDYFGRPKVGVCRLEVDLLLDILIAHGTIKISN
jgi:hypothetical protein